MDRVLKVLIQPSLLALVVAGGSGLLLAEAWKSATIDADNLNSQIYDRAMADRGYYDGIMEQVSGTTDTILIIVAIETWLTALVWFFACWRTPIAEVGAARRLRSRWWWICVIGLLLGLALAAYVAFLASPLSALIMLRPLLYLFLFVVPFCATIYYAASVFSTHRVYLPAIPGSRWRTW